MDVDRLKQAAERLELEVESALSAGYENADCVLTGEVRRLLALAKAGQIHMPVQLKYASGPAWNFSETKLGECRDLEEAWARFRSIIEGWEFSPGFLKFKASRGEG